jgi:hypothetical protein
MLALFCKEAERVTGGFGIVRREGCEQWPTHSVTDPVTGVKCNSIVEDVLSKSWFD